MNKVLTGITPSGIPHLGNYIGAIKPALELAQNAHQSFLFIADNHALIKCRDPEMVAKSRQMLAATWLACGLDYTKSTFYRQSDVPEITELAWILSCVAQKSKLNLMHAYKAASAENLRADQYVDTNISMGLYSYPVLMAADILLFGATHVPVGSDQDQHIQFARDLAATFNEQYGQTFSPPQAVISSTPLLLGQDGRKMSKSYGNVIPQFEGGKSGLALHVKNIVTDLLPPGVVNGLDNSIYSIYQAFGTSSQSSEFARMLIDGISWKDAKQHLTELLENCLAEKRIKYHEYMTSPETMEPILQDGAGRARTIAKEKMREVRDAVGFRAPIAKSAAVRKVVPKIVQYREDGWFFFKLVCGNTTLLQSDGYASGKEVASAISELMNGVVDGTLLVSHQTILDALNEMKS